MFQIILISSSQFCFEKEFIDSRNIQTLKIRSSHTKCIFKLNLVDTLIVDSLSITLYGILLNYVSVVPTTTPSTTEPPDEGTNNPGDGSTTNSEHLYVLVHKFQTTVRILLYGHPIER